MSAYRSDRIRMARVVLPTALGTLASSLAYILQLQNEGFSLLASAIAVSLIGTGVLTGHILNNSVIAVISERGLSLRQGWRLLGTRPTSIPLEHIHTLEITRVPGRNPQEFKPGQLVIIYRRPAKKMLHATVDFSIASMPNGAEFILELAQRTGAKIKLHTGGKGSPHTVTTEELKQRLALPDASVSSDENVVGSA